MTTNFPFSTWTWIKPLRIQLQEKSLKFDELIGSKEKRWSLKGRKFISFSDVFTAAVVVDA